MNHVLVAGKLKKGRKAHYHDVKVVTPESDELYEEGDAIGVEKTGNISEIIHFGMRLLVFLL